MIPTSIREKLGRADVHIGELKEAIDAFFEDGGYTFRVERYFQDGEWYQGQFSIWATPEMPVPVDEWGVLIGEIVHDLGSALDHMVWALTVAHCGGKEPTDVYAARRTWQQFQFPIFTEGGEYKRQRDSMLGASSHP